MLPGPHIPFKMKNLIASLITTAILFGIPLAFMTTYAEAQSCRFRVGEIIHTILDDRRGQIIEKKGYIASGCTYQVRFVIENERALASTTEQPGDSRSPYSIVRMWDYELTKEEQY